MAEADRPALELPPILDEVRASLPTTGPAWLVGGAVRDLLLGRRPQDFDFVMPGDARITLRSRQGGAGGPSFRGSTSG